MDEVDGVVCNAEAAAGEVCVGIGGDFAHEEAELRGLTKYLASFLFADPVHGEPVEGYQDDHGCKHGDEGGA